MGLFCYLIQAYTHALFIISSGVNDFKALTDCNTPPELCMNILLMKSTTAQISWKPTAWVYRGFFFSSNYASPPSFIISVSLFSGGWGGGGRGIVYPQLLMSLILNAHWSAFRQFLAKASGEEEEKERGGKKEKRSLHCTFLSRTSSRTAAMLQPQHRQKEIDNINFAVNIIPTAYDKDSAFVASTGRSLWLQFHFWSMATFSARVGSMSCFVGSTKTAASRAKWSYKTRKNQAKTDPRESESTKTAGSRAKWPYKTRNNQATPATIWPKRICRRALRPPPIEQSDPTRPETIRPRQQRFGQNGFAEEH